MRRQLCLIDVVAVCLIGIGGAAAALFGMTWWWAGGIVVGVLLVSQSRTGR